MNFGVTGWLVKITDAIEARVNIEAKDDAIWSVELVALKGKGLQARPIDDVVLL